MILATAAASTASTLAPVLALVPVQIVPTAPEEMFGDAAFVGYADEDGAIVRIDRTITGARREQLVREYTRKARGMVATFRADAAADRAAAAQKAARKARLDALVVKLPAAWHGIGTGNHVANGNRAGGYTNATRRWLRAMMAATA